MKTHDEILNHLSRILDDHVCGVVGCLECDGEHGLWYYLEPLLAEREWQPIETAPKDGTKVMLYVGDCLEWITAPWYWDTRDGLWKNTIGQYMETPFITHWMPLPQPPNEETSA